MLHQKDLSIEKTKKPIAWELRCLDSQRDEELRKSCTKRLEVPGRKGQFTKDTDFDKYVGLLTVECVVFPNLNCSIYKCLFICR